MPIGNFEQSVDVNTQGLSTWEEEILPDHSRMIYHFHCGDRKTNISIFFLFESVKHPCLLQQKC